MQNAKKIIIGIFTTILAIILIFNIYNFICLKLLHKDVATVEGYAILEVVSGSMEPTIHKGDMIIIDTKEKDYRVNDIVTFKDKEGSLVTHRIIFIDKGKMVTRGDNNNTEDASYPTSAIVGKYVKSIAGAGIILSSFKNPLTMIMIFVIGLLICFLISTDADGNPILDSDELEFQEFLKMKEEQEDKNKEEKKESNKNQAKKENKKTKTKKVNKKEEPKKSSNEKNNNKTKETKGKNNKSKKEVTKKVSTNKKQNTKPKNPKKKKKTTKKASKKKTK